jgi:hypothetical protein
MAISFSTLPTVCRISYRDRKPISTKAPENRRQPGLNLQATIVARAAAWNRFVISGHVVDQLPDIV